MAREKLGERMSVILDDETRQAIENAMEATGEKVAATLLRKAIKAGLPLITGGGTSDALTLDSELSKSVEDEARRAKRTRNSILLDAIRYGLEAVGIYEMIKEAKAKGEMDDVLAQTILAQSELDIHPEKRAAKVAMSERAVFWTQVWDLMTHVPEARERKEAIEKLIEYRIAAKHWKRVWGCGLRTSEIKWQVAMYEKYGLDTNQWPKEEFQKHEAENEAEERANPKMKESPNVQAIPQAVLEAMKDPANRALLLGGRGSVQGSGIASDTTSANDKDAEKSKRKGAGKARK